MGKKITIDLEAQTATFINGVDNAGKTLDGFGKHAEKASGFLDNFKKGFELGSGFEAAHQAFELIGDGIEKVKSAFEEVGEIGRGALRLGISTEAFSRLKYAADISHVSMEQVEGDLGKMLAGIEKASEGDKALAGTFEKLHLNIQQLKSAEPSAAFEQIGDAIAHVSNSAERMEYVREVFGKAGTAILPMIENLRQLETEADNVGFTRTEDDIRKINELEEQWKRGTELLNVAFMNLAVTTTPALEGIIARLVKAAKWTIDIVKGIDEQLGGAAYYRFSDNYAKAEADKTAAREAFARANEAAGKDIIKTYEAQKQYVDALTNAIKDLAAAETDADKVGEKGEGSRIADQIDAIKKGLAVASTALHTFKAEYDRVQEAAKAAAAAEAEDAKKLIETRKEQEKQLKQFEADFAKAKRDRERAADAGVETFQRLTEDPYVLQYAKNIKELDAALKEHRLTQEQFAKGASAARAALDRDEEKSKEHLDRFQSNRHPEMEERRFSFVLPTDQHGEDAVAVQRQQFTMLQQWDNYIRQIYNTITGPAQNQDIVSSIP